MSNDTKTGQTSVIRDLLPEPTLQRLPWYLAYVCQLRAQGVENVSSTQISKHLNVDSSQIAKDLSFLNIRGKTRIGYDVVELENTLKDFLEFERQHPAVIIGVGSLGAALIQASVNLAPNAARTSLVPTFWSKRTTYARPPEKSTP